MKKIVTVDGEALTVDGEVVETDDDGTTTEYNIGAGLQLDAETNTLSVNVASAVEEGNTNPVMSAAVWGLIGNLSDLTTTAKENLVAAINEAAKTGSGGAGSIDLRTADGYIQYSNDGGATWENLIALADLKGEKGDTGAPGPQGVPGEQGPQGKTGQQGPQGKTGPAGTDGAPGKDGSPGKDGADGAPGQDGFSPSASVAKTATGATITITDKTGTTTAEIKNGKDGAPGKDGTNGAPGTPGKDGTDGKDGTTFTPSVSAAGDLSWTNDGGKANPAPVNIKGPQGADYTLTDADKTEIAAEAAAAIAGTSLPAPASAAVGQIVKIKAVDAAGKITETEAVDIDKPWGWELINEITIPEGSDEIMEFDINTDSNGKPFKLHRFMMIVNMPIYTGESEIPTFGYGKINGNVYNSKTYPSPMVYTNVNEPSKTEPKIFSWMEGDIMGNGNHMCIYGSDKPTSFIHGGFLVATGSGGLASYARFRYLTGGPQSLYDVYRPITSVGLRNILMFAGCKVWLYGTRV